jgi:UDP:flavonoid glycosyltransferase YjiC (YdhE family)
MRIVLAAEGTRGDAQPLIELGRRLRAAGHGAILCSSPDFAAQAGSRGVPFVACGTSIRDLIAARAAVIERSPVGALLEGIRMFRARFEERLEVLLELARGADLVVGAGAELAASVAAEARGAAYRYVVYCPGMIPSREHAPVFLPWQDLPGWVNRALWPALIRPTVLALRGVIGPARKRLGLAPRRDLYRMMLSARPLLAVDAALACAPADAPFPLDQVAALHPTCGDPLPAKLESFLAMGPPPVYLGFGSMPDADPAATTRTLLEAIARTGRRALIGAGWAALGDGPLPEGVLAIESVSHPMLFPRCAAIVHHGGAGTTTTAARAGVPQVVVPHLADQFYWARRVERLGIAVAAMTRRRLDAAVLAASIREACDNEILAERARDLGVRLRDEAAASDPVASLA